MREGRGDRAREREGIRRQAAVTSHDAGDADVQYYGLHIVDQLENLVLAVCNLAESMDCESTAVGPGPPPHWDEAGE